MKVLAVIPAFNEASRIATTIAAVRPLVDGIVVVDDGSADHTADAVPVQNGVTVLRHALNRGQGAALRTGTEAALMLGADVIVHVDADGQHDPSFIPSLVKPIADDKADVVFGSRFLGEVPEGIPLVRRALLHAARTFNVMAMGIPRRVTDPQSGMRALSAKAARQVDFVQDRMAHCSEILRRVTRSSLRWMEVPVRIRYTAESLAKGQKSTDALKIAWQLFIGVFAD
jgi:glycosyltransferase involved in cell wall biosynthesis